MSQVHDVVAALLAEPRFRRFGPLAYGERVGPRTVACLVFVGLGYQSPERKAVQATLIGHFGSERALIRRLVAISDRRMLDYARNPLYSWLSTDGLFVVRQCFADYRALRLVNVAHHSWYHGEFRVAG